MRVTAVPKGSGPLPGPFPSCIGGEKGRDPGEASNWSQRIAKKGSWRRKALVTVQSRKLGVLWVPGTDTLLSQLLL